MLASIHVIAAEERKKRRIRKLAENMIKGQLGDGLLKLATKKVAQADPTLGNKTADPPELKPVPEPAQAEDEESSALRDKHAPRPQSEAKLKSEFFSKSEENTQKGGGKNKVLPQNPSKSATLLKWNASQRSWGILSEKGELPSAKK